VSGICSRGLTFDDNIQIRPANKEELFNLCHASARNVIERIFGVLKRRFRILLLAPEYGLDIQAQIPAALCALHNFIRVHDAFEDSTMDNFEGDDELVDSGGNSQSVADAGANEVNEVDFFADANGGKQLRNEIATSMWRDYQNILHERSGQMNIDEDNDFDSELGHL